MKKKVTCILMAVADSTRFCFKYAPLRHATWIISELIFMLIPLAVLKIWQFIINELSVGTASHAVWICVGAYLLIKILEVTIASLNKHNERMSFAIMEYESRALILEKLKNIDVGKFFDPKYQDIMSVIFDAPGYQTVFSNTLQVLKNSALVIIAFVAIWKRYPVSGIVLICSYIPALTIGLRNSNKSYNLRADNRSNYRKVAYYRDVLTGKATAAELRLFGFETAVKGLYTKLWEQLFNAETSQQIRQAIQSMIANAIAPVGFIVIIMSLLFDIKNSRIIAGDVSFCIGLILMLMASIDTFQDILLVYYSNCVECAGTLQAFLGIHSDLDTAGKLSVPRYPKIEFINVSFKYPGTEEYTLKDVSFTINPHEKIALVGVNGAGKTTLTKLICRLYDPTNGEIRLNNVPLKEYEIGELYSLFGVMMQSSKAFDISFKENVILADAEQMDKSAFDLANKASTAQSIVDRLPMGSDSILGRSYDADGLEMSGGDIQKIAMARAYYRNADILIFDEPSSALDAEAENEIFRNIERYCEDKSIILVSHRLSAIRLVDKILLLEDGEIIEQGTHDYLIHLDGRYAELYSMQANEYTSRA